MVLGMALMEMIAFDEECNCLGGSSTVRPEPLHAGGVGLGALPHGDAAAGTTRRSQGVGKLWPSAAPVAGRGLGRRRRPQASACVMLRPP